MTQEGIAPFRLVILPCRPAPGFQATAELEAAFALWREVVPETYKSLGKSGRIASDQFTRQDVVAGIFAGERCAGMVCFRRIDTSCAIDRGDSWFLAWPEELLVSLGAESPRGLVISFLLVHPDFRRGMGENGRSGPSISTMVVKTASLLFRESGAQLAYGATRNDRGVNKLAYAAGWRPVLQGVSQLGHDSDLIVLRPKEAAEAGAAYEEEMLKLWAERTVHTDLRLYDHVIDSK